MRHPSILILLAAGCALPRGVDTAKAPVENQTSTAVTEVQPSTELVDFEPSAGPATRLDRAVPADLSSRIASFFAGNGSRRAHVQLDRPLYRPGETVWVKTWAVNTRGLAPTPDTSVTYELIDPRGATVETKSVLQSGGAATNDFVLPGDAPGGKWMARVTLPWGEVDERPFIVSSYQAPRIRKDLELVREAYGPGDKVDALLELERATGGPMAGHKVTVLLQVDGQSVAEEQFTTDDTGAVLVSATLPATLTSGDGMLTVLVDDGGVTESVSRSVPIVLADVQLALLPEGGDLVVGLPGRVYFEGKNRHGEPADVEGYVSDDRGQRVAAFRSVHDGMGRFAFTPEAGRVYTAHITAPVGVAQHFQLPEARSTGCSVRSYDDVHSAVRDLRVGVRCAPERDVVVTGILREDVLDAGRYHAGPDADTVIHLDAPDALADRQGAVVVTVFDTDLDPLAERLVYRNAGKDLSITVTPGQAQYGPRDRVSLDVVATDPSGDPVAAQLALSVVDDTVLSFANDEEGHMLSRLYLERELVDSPKDPGWYFDEDEALAARGLDLLMGTRGYRRFEWQQVLHPAPPVVETVSTTTGRSRDRERWAKAAEVEEGDVLELAAAPRMVPGVAAQPEPVAKPAKRPRRPMEVDEVLVADMPVAADPPMDDGVAMGRAERAPMRQKEDKKRKDMAAGAELRELGVLGYLDGDFEVAGEDRRGGGFRAGWAPVRVFPKPDYAAGFQGTRTDFRDTVLWEPSVATNAQGKASLSFYLSDAITTFRVTAEGLGAGYAGHGEATFSSVLPVSLATKLPPAVSAGDRIDLPITVTNTRKDALDVRISGTFDAALVTAHGADGKLKVGGSASQTYWMPLEIGQGSQTVAVRLSAEGGGMSDTMEQSLQVVPAGFPRTWSAAGELARDKQLTVLVDDDIVPGSLTASVSWHPSPVASLISGMEGLIQTPGGCFEQTSSTNWPNVAILSYLEAHGGDPRLRMKSAQAMDVGYAKLTGYQVGSGGFETWGSGPGKEALSAFGLLQFRDMKEVYPVADKVLTQDAKYLLSQRDGKGGFKNSGESAHGYGSAPPEVLNGFITFALVETGHAGGLKAELDHQAALGRTTSDPYVLALAARSLASGKHAAAPTASKRLAGLQAADGSFPGAESSITRSYEANLVVESTALAALALMESGDFRTEVDKAVAWIVANRQGGGTWGATQATALALNALTEYAAFSARPQADGVLFLEVNGKTVRKLPYSADAIEALTIDGWADQLRPGKNTVVLRHEGGEPLPFTVDVRWNSPNPSTDPGAELSLDTRLERTEVAMGDTVRLTATVRNRTAAVVPSPIARIGLPAGLEAQTWQLKQLQERGEIAFFETRPREVTLYWDGIHTDEVHEIGLDLVATVPGAFTGPASSAYPYYDDDEKAWGRGLAVSIARPAAK